MSVADDAGVSVGGVAEGGGDGQAVHGRRRREVGRLPRAGRVERAVVLLVPVGRALVLRNGYRLCAQYLLCTDG